MGAGTDYARFPGDIVPAERDPDYAAVLYVGGYDVPVTQDHGVVGVPDVAGRRAGHPGVPVAPHDLPGGDVDDGDDEVVFLSGNDVAPIGGKEGVVRYDERLAGRQVTGLRPGPTDVALGVDDEQAVVQFVGDQHRAREDAGVRTGRQVRSGHRGPRTVRTSSPRGDGWDSKGSPRNLYRRWACPRGPRGQARAAGRGR